MNKILTKVTTVSLVVVLAGSLAACNKTAAPPNTSHTQNYRVNEYQANPVAPRYNDGMYMNRAPQPPSNTAQLYTTERAAADRMVHTARKVPGVAHATAVVNGKDAVIGLDITNTAAQNKRAVEYKVANAVKKAEPGYNVHVTTDTQLNQRIRTLNTQVQAGHPIRTLANDVGVIIQDIGRAVTAPFR
ncbi:YhcN/YlaJ family sporulation lipoprotein [Aneurinibacillus soli]|uniref:Sporulation lipoprotein YhcN/YlaJ n=1 Tax=Aneurinibacillus soli TaxID=1500254 RepID=A0A0U5B529_9BACL|nr:YhcN/YlaJ family sporulation lipoprotein [Aneurinibacillus soli]PYE58064.1 YhcN/YlaJ family sporulation lipoprotein [Aneurinibacillus soli]BAU25965.1 sporulation lipoprotein YhcN/YlaJ [Aneurinibacillus soli]